MKKLLAIVVFNLAFAAFCHSQTRIEAKDASRHLNEEVTICDKVYSAKFFTASSLTLLDVGGSHPNELLTVVIKAEDRKKFKGSPDEMYKGKTVCITGKVIEFKGKPEIVVTEPAQIKVN